VSDDHEHPFTRFWLEPGRQRRFTDVAFGTWKWVARMAMAGTGTRHAARYGKLGDGSGFGFPPGASMNEHLVHIGSRTLIGPDVTMSVGMWPGEELDAPDGWIIRIGDRCNIGRRCALVGRSRIEIGDDVTFAPDVYVTDHNHRYDDPDTPITKQWVDSDPVSIGSGCWLGARAIVLPGTTLGRNVVVAGGSVVRGDVPDHSVVAGVPAKVVRRREDGEWIPPITDPGDPPPPGWPDG
jgi:acetyltransferase-like isoleucine patch superfamily enzyme